MGQTRLDSGLAAVIISTIPIWLVGLDITTRQLEPSFAVLAPPIVGLVGVAIIANPNVEQPADAFGIALILAAALCWALGSRRSREHPALNTTEQTAMQMLAGGLLLLLIAATLGVSGHSPGRLTRAGAAGLLWLVIVSSMIGFSAYTYALKNAPIAAVAAYPYANIVIAVTLGTIVLDEPLTTNRSIGACLIVSSVLATQIHLRQRSHRIRQRSPTHQHRWR